MIIIIRIIIMIILKIVTIIVIMITTKALNFTWGICVAQRQIPTVEVARRRKLSWFVTMDDDYDDAGFMTISGNDLLMIAASIGSILDMAGRRQKLNLGMKSETINR